MWTDRPLTSITLGDLQQLVTDKVRENRQLDYKDEQPAHPQANNDKKSEFAVDISALANGSGGLLIYGVAEEKENNRPTGIASALNGLAGVNLDADGNHLRNYLETALDPKLPAGIVELHTIDGGSSGPLLLVRVRKSYSGPHMVRAEGRFRNSFYIRDGARNRQLDAKGIRDAMFAAGDWPRRFRAWRRDRIAAILAAETPVVLSGSRRLILHIAPVASLDDEPRLDVTVAQKQAAAKQIVSFGSTLDYRTDRFNVDGLVVWTFLRDSPCLDYLQVFRSGLLETVDITCLENGEELATGTIESQLIKLAPLYTSYLRDLAIDPPFVIGLTLVGVRGMRHAEQSELARARRDFPTFDRDVITLPELFVDAEQLGQPAPTYLAPMIHALWQAGGRPGCPRYAADGTYSPR